MTNPYLKKVNLNAAISKAKKYSKKITLKPSTRKNKKKRKAYRARHKKDLLIDPKNKFTAGKLAYYILW